MNYQMEGDTCIICLELNDTIIPSKCDNCGGCKICSICYDTIVTGIQHYDYNNTCPICKKTNWIQRRIRRCVYICSICHGTGHNRRTCPHRAVPLPAIQEETYEDLEYLHNTRFTSEESKIIFCFVQLILFVIVFVMMPCLPYFIKKLNA